MSLLFFDSFDHYARNDIGKKWSFRSTGLFATLTSTLRAGAGRNNTTAFEFKSAVNSAQIAQNLGVDRAVLYVGYAFKVAEYGESVNQTFFELSHNNTIKIGYAMTGGGQIGVWRGDFATFLGYLSRPLNQNRWYYLEFLNNVHSQTGQIDIRVDGRTEFSFIGNTQVGTVAAMNRMSLGRADVGLTGESHKCLIDDLYVCDDQGTRNNNFLGDVRVVALMPNSDGDTIQWDASTTGTNYQMVSETIPDSARTYNSTSVTAEIDTFHMANLGTGSAYVLAAQTVLMARQDDPSRSVRPLLTTNGSLYAGATVALTGSEYTFLQEIFELNPVTATSWTVADVDSHQAGYELVA